MKQTLYLFNPENDMALACGDPYYMAPARARRMAADLSALPSWYAEEGAWVALDSEVQVEWMKHVSSMGERVADATSNVPMNSWVPASVRWTQLEETLFGQKDAAFSRQAETSLQETESSLQQQDSIGRICPWGWNPSLVRRLREAGVPEALLPDAERMRQIRTLSGRQTAVRVLQRLREREAVEALPDRVRWLGESFVLTSAAEVESFVVAHPKAVLKAPWSGSGRGVQYTQGEFTSPLQGWVRHILHTQQAVVGEPFYDKVLDFAMEFRAEITKDDRPSFSVRFAGYSWFETDARGLYKENWLASDAVIEARLAEFVSVTDLHRLQKLLEFELEHALQGAYEGDLGVDMMICRDGVSGGYALHPCVEINLRTNMGVVARRLYDRYVCPTSQGRYVIDFFPQPGAALQTHLALQKAHPLVLQTGRIRSGYCSLNPVFESTQYLAFIRIEE